VMKTKKTVSGRGFRPGLACAALLAVATVFAGAFSAPALCAQDKDRQAGTVYHPGKDVTNPLLTYAPDPEFPKSSKAAPGSDTICVVGVIVDSKGLPQDVHVVQSAGKDFDASAMRAVRQYRFTPGNHEGRPVAVAISIRVNFRKY